MRPTTIFTTALFLTAAPQSKVVRVHIDTPIPSSTSAALVTGGPKSLRLDGQPPSAARDTLEVRLPADLLADLSRGSVRIEIIRGPSVAVRVIVSSSSSIISATAPRLLIAEEDNYVSVSGIPEPQR